MRYKKFYSIATNQFFIVGSKTLNRISGDNNNSESVLDSKSNQWFGATVRSSGENGVIVVSNKFTI